MTAPPAAVPPRRRAPPSLRPARASPPAPVEEQDHRRRVGRPMTNSARPPMETGPAARRPRIPRPSKTTWWVTRTTVGRRPVRRITDPGHQWRGTSRGPAGRPCGPPRGPGIDPLQGRVRGGAVAEGKLTVVGDRVLGGRPPHGPPPQPCRRGRPPPTPGPERP